jgi:hypothetical protein
LLDLSPGTVSLMVGHHRRDLPIDRVLRIEVRGDSLKNGALTGAVALGLWTALLAGQGSLEPGYVIYFSAINAGLGAAIGAGIDALIPGRTTIYTKPAAQARLRVSF